MYFAIVCTPYEFVVKSLVRFRKLIFFASVVTLISTMACCATFHVEECETKMPQCIIAHWHSQPGVWEEVSIPGVVVNAASIDYRIDRPSSRYLKVTRRDQHYTLSYYSDGVVMWCMNIHREGMDCANMPVGRESSPPLSFIKADMLMVLTCKYRRDYRLKKSDGSLKNELSKYSISQTLDDVYTMTGDFHIIGKDLDLCVQAKINGADLFSFYISDLSANAQKFWSKVALGLPTTPKKVNRAVWDVSRPSITLDTACLEAKEAVFPIQDVMTNPHVLSSDNLAVEASACDVGRSEHDSSTHCAGGDALREGVTCGAEKRMRSPQPTPFYLTRTAANMKIWFSKQGAVCDNTLLMFQEYIKRQLVGALFHIDGVVQDGAVFFLLRNDGGGESVFARYVFFQNETWDPRVDVRSSKVINAKIYPCKKNTGNWVELMLNQGNLSFSAFNNCTRMDFPIASVDGKLLWTCEHQESMKSYTEPYSEREIPMSMNFTGFTYVQELEPKLCQITFSNTCRLWISHQMTWELKDNALRLCCHVFLHRYKPIHLLLCSLPCDETGDIKIRAVSTLNNRVCCTAGDYVLNVTPTTNENCLSVNIEKGLHVVFSGAAILQSDCAPPSFVWQKNIDHPYHWHVFVPAFEKYGNTEMKIICEKIMRKIVWAKNGNSTNPARVLLLKVPQIDGGSSQFELESFVRYVKNQGYFWCWSYKKCLKKEPLHVKVPPMYEKLDLEDGYVKVSLLSKEMRNLCELYIDIARMRCDGMYKLQFYGEKDCKFTINL